MRGNTVEHACPECWGTIEAILGCALEELTISPPPGRCYVCGKVAKVNGNGVGYQGHANWRTTIQAHLGGVMACLRGEAAQGLGTAMERGRDIQELQGG